MDDKQTDKNGTPCDSVSKARVTYACFNRAPDDLNNVPLDTKKVDINVETSSPYMKKSQLILDTNEKFSCNNGIFINEDNALNTIYNALNEAETELLDVNTSHVNCSFSLSSEDETFLCNRSSVLDVGKIQDVCDDMNGRGRSSISEMKSSVSSSDDFYSSRNSLSSDSESDGIVTFLDKSNSEAESRLAARRQARAEAREIRMREIERQQKEAEENADKAFDMHSADGSIRGSRVGGNSVSPRTPSSIINNSYQSSRRNSIDSLDESTPNFRDLRMELKDLEEKFRKAMVQNAQLDNEKSAVTYMVELYKDKYTDIEEELMHIKREHKETSRENEKLKRLLATQKFESMSLQQELEERDKLIEEKGLVIISTEQDSNDNLDQNNKQIKRALVSVENAQFLQHAGEGSLDVRLKKLTEERNSYLDEIKQLKLELQEAKCYSDSHYNGSDSDDLEDVQKESNKVLGDYKFKWQKAEQDISTLQANVARLESQVIRYKAASEAAEKAEDELKLEKRKLQRELRESQAKVEELETSNMHLLKRFDKLKNAKSSLLKDL